MTNYLKAALLIFLLNITLTAQSIPQKFFEALISENGNIKEFINPNELEKSERLGINYKDVDVKALLTYDIPPDIKQNIINGTYKYEIKEHPIADNYTEVTFIIPDTDYQRRYYFKNGFVFNSTFLTDSWEKKHSKYFSFRLQEPKYFNDYCIQRLDDFVDIMTVMLNFSEDEKRLLEKEKIYYTFCTDEKEVEKITGFRSKGMALLANDEVVTAYQTHFHEVAHILINYKIKTPGLYTLPFFMEGFAVAMGGRGGMAPRVVADVGAYLQTTGFLTYDSILTNEQFYNTDANMSYALSGLYNKFLLIELGVEKYLELYKSVNGNLDFVKSIRPENINLPSKEKFEKFLSEFNREKIMYVDKNDTNEAIKISGFNARFINVNNYYKFFSTGRFSIGSSSNFIRDYKSRKYNEQYKINDNCVFKYCIILSENELDVYNLYNDELIYSYSKGLSVNPFTIPLDNGEYIFFLRKDLFEEDFQNEIMVDGSTR
jgi:hypothetical protein